LYAILGEQSSNREHLDYVGQVVYIISMKILPLAEVKTHFSSLMKEVESGDEIGISFGRKKETIAVIMPINEYRKINARKLGTLEGKVKVEFKNDWAMTDEELIQ
jgi:antitoxin (DNA-binding transcriptional repressor) of toxin-antitoxin stability system